MISCIDFRYIKIESTLCLYIDETKKKKVQNGRLKKAIELKNKFSFHVIHVDLRINKPLSVKRGLNSLPHNPNFEQP